ncbi:MAG: hypothetical protein LBK29_04230 [Oscillospiraceae bacterium]|nr:hypothetical protein [Oscillospiraceae bacterium]
MKSLILNLGAISVSAFFFTTIARDIKCRADNCEDTLAVVNSAENEKLEEISAKLNESESLHADNDVAGIKKENIDAVQPESLHVNEDTASIEKEDINAVQSNNILNDFNKSTAVNSVAVERKKDAKQLTIEEGFIAKWRNERDQRKIGFISGIIAKIQKDLESKNKLVESHESVLDELEGLYESYKHALSLVGLQKYRDLREEMIRNECEASKIKNEIEKEKNQIKSMKERLFALESELNCMLSLRENNS